MTRLFRSIAALGLAAAATLALAQPALAEGDPIPVDSACLTGWYVNPDEGDLLPLQQPDGLLFDGPSLVHHAIQPPIGLADLEPGTFDADVQTGVAPLFKVETTSPYSTLNYVGDGTSDLWWSSKFAPADPGGQDHPIAAADFVGKGTYTAQTTVYSFGVGYANDAGNKAVVSSVTFGGQTYDLTCQPPTTETTTAAVETTTTTAAVETTSTTTSAAPTLPVTGAPLTGILIAGVVLVAVGVVAYVIAAAARRRHG